MISSAHPQFVLLQKAIAAALAGDKQTARELLEQITALHPESELAWLWLASVSSTPEETLRCWRRVCQINPHQEQALNGLKRLLLQEGIKAAQENRPEDARALLLELTQLDEQNEAAWLWLANITPDAAEAARYTARVLQLNPANERALAWMEKLRAPVEAPGAITSATAAALPTKSATAWSCPLCLYVQDEQSAPLCVAGHCPNCRAIVSLTSLDEILNNSDVNVSLLQDAVRRLEEQVTRAGEEADDQTLFHLGIGYLNLKRVEEGAQYLRQATARQRSEAKLSAQIETFLTLMSEAATTATAASSLAQEPIVTDEASDEALLEEPVIREPASSEVPLPNAGGMGPYIILVVDDSPTVRKLVAMTLEKYGHQVLSATNGLDALNKLQEVVPDLILSDINMPHMDGYQLCKMIRGNAVTCNVPVIMLSGKEGVFDKLRGRMVGATAYLTKPFEIESLLQLIDMHCQPSAV